MATKKRDLYCVHGHPLPRKKCFKSLKAASAFAMREGGEYIALRRIKRQRKARR